ncbi:XK-related protein 9 [Synchiropus splendidus]|uniref:XK-related protein 9 n=1 Tax=Synchiropus splendidus TaxID=270530 RepID=UPI00237EAAA8|nr:XK-related protein 9 [Synchiropus splendidus]
MSARYSKVQWLVTLIGIFFYCLDIGTDVALVVQYFQEENYLWMSLTALFVLTGMVVTQLFSYSWYLDDKEDALFYPKGKEALSGVTEGGVIALHVFGLSIFTRYCHLLSRSFSVVWKGSYDQADNSGIHQHLFRLATDLSMLKLFESFLESVPQLLLQTYINLGHHESSVVQYVSIAFSFCSIAWALVDFRRCQKRSQPQSREMPSGLPTMTYLFYKLFSITSHILSLILLLTLSTYSTIALAVLWLLATIWTHFLQTHFCSTKCLEFIYRGVIGVILTFTFFNVKRLNTKVPMTVYYVLSSTKNVAAILLLGFLKPEAQNTAYFLPVSCVIYAGTVLGMLCLLVYYRFLHHVGDADEVDGPQMQNEVTTRMRNFMQA